MDIVLDSNVFRSDILLRSKDFDVLFDYLQKTSSGLLMPQIILDEIKSLYSKALTDRLADLNKATNNINLTLTEEDISFKHREINIISEVEKYEAFVKNKFKIKDKYILRYNNDYLPEIANRAINRQKPCGEKGQGFRDTLIWLTIKDYTKKCHEKQITFISNNTDDFGNQEKNSLHEALSKECDVLGIRINYFKTVREFIENHSSKIDFITYDWLASNLNYDVIGDSVLSKINERNRSGITSRFEKETGDEATGYYNALSFNPYSENDLFVYEMVDNKLVLNVTIAAEIEIEFEYYQYEKIRQWNNDEYYHIKERRPASKTIFLDTQLYVTLIIERGEIVDTELSDWDYY